MDHGLCVMNQIVVLLGIFFLAFNYRDSPLKLPFPIGRRSSLSLGWLRLGALACFSTSLLLECSLHCCAAVVAMVIATLSARYIIVIPKNNVT
jgi:hypothetical protein